MTNNTTTYEYAFKYSWYESKRHSISTTDMTFDKPNTELQEGYGYNNESCQGYMRIQYMPCDVNHINKYEPPLKSTIVECANTFIPENDIDLDDVLIPNGMDWSFDKPNKPHRVVYIFEDKDGD